MTRVQTMWSRSGKPNALVQGLPFHKTSMGRGEKLVWIINY